jgi:hypothetical protein
MSERNDYISEIMSGLSLKWNFNTKTYPLTRGANQVYQKRPEENGNYTSFIYASFRCPCLAPPAQDYIKVTLSLASGAVLLKPSTQMEKAIEKLYRVPPWTGNSSRNRAFRPKKLKMLVRLCPSTLIEAFKF